MVSRRTLAAAATLLVVVTACGTRTEDAPTVFSSAAASLPTPTPVARPAVAAGVIPKVLTIPALGLSAPIEAKPTEMQWDSFLGRAVPSFGVPDNLTGTVWWSSGARPGGTGLAVVIGHTKHAGAAVFNHLVDLGPGASIVISGDARQLHYRVVAVVGQLSKSDAYALQNALERPPAGAQLALITCTGDFNGHTTLENSIVFAAPAPFSP